MNIFVMPCQIIILISKFGWASSTLSFVLLMSWTISKSSFNMLFEKKKKKCCLPESLPLGYLLPQLLSSFILTRSPSPSSSSSLSILFKQHHCQHSHKQLFLPKLHFYSWFKFHFQLCQFFNSVTLHLCWLIPSFGYQFL